MKKNFLTLKDLSRKQLEALITRALWFKKNKKFKKVLSGKVLGLIFEKSSTRTRVSFEVAMFRLGGETIYLEQSVTQLGRGETYADTGRVLSRYLDGIVMRTFEQERLTDLAGGARIPVINGLSDLVHPCQILADLMTVREQFGNSKNLKIAYVGDGNNIANTWIQASMIFGFSLSLACPKGYWPDQSILGDLDDFPQIRLHDNPVDAVTGSHVVNTDTWFSMGQEVTDDKRKAFIGFQINKELLRYAKKDAIVLHCLPAHRGEEITDEVMDGSQSAVFDQAENRLYVQMALLELLMR